MSCEQQLRVQAYADGELDALAALAVEKHLETCAECRALQADILVLRKAVTEQATYHRPSEFFARRVRRSIDAEGRTGGRRAFLRGAASGAGAMAIAASLAFFLVTPPLPDAMANDVVAAHLRSLMGTHLIDVASSSHHVVKPWFAGHADISPPVSDFAAKGFSLVGGRVDYVDGERAAVVVYRHGAHVVNVFSWRDDGRAHPGTRSIDGYHLLAWKAGGLFFCAVSDMDAGELQALVGMIRQQSPA